MTIHNVMDYGAVGNDFADDSTAIANAIAACLPGDTVYFPGSHIFTCRGYNAFQYKSHIIFEGDDWTSVVKLRANQNCNVFENVHYEDITGGDQGVIFRHFKIDGNRGNQTHDLGTPRHGIAAYYVDGLTIEDMWIIGCEKDAIYLGVANVHAKDSGPCNNVVIHDCLFEGSQRHGIGITNARNVEAYRNSFRQIDDLGVDFEPNVGTDVIENMFFYNNSFYNIGMASYPSDGNGTCFSLQASGGSFHDIKIYGNWIYGDHPDGFTFGKCSSPTAHNVYVIGNVGYGNISGGMYNSGTSNHFWYFGNRFTTIWPWLDDKYCLTSLTNASYIYYESNYVTDFYYGLHSQTGPGTTLDHITYIHNVSDVTPDVSGGGGTYTNIVIEDNSLIPPDPTINKTYTLATPSFMNPNEVGALVVWNWEGASSIKANLAGIATDGNGIYRLVNAYNFNESMQFYGVDAGSVVIPMGANSWSPVYSVGMTEDMASQMPGFAVFIVEFVGEAPCVITVPAVGVTSIATRYFVVLKNVLGERVAIFNSFQKLEYEKIVNDVGHFALSVDGNDPRTALFELDGQVEVYRSIPSLGLDWYLDYEGLHRSPKISTDESGLFVFTSAGVGYNDFLARTIIGYKAGTIRADKNAASETVMKEFVLENCGTNASPYTVVGRLSDGYLTGFSVETNGGAGATWAGSRAFENLLETLQDIANTALIDFLVLGVGPALFEFRTYEDQMGIDRTLTGLTSNGLNGAGNLPVVFSLPMNNIQNVEFEHNRIDEKNVVYVLGKGEGSTRTVNVRHNSGAKDDSPWNRRETSRGATNQDYSYQLDQTGDEILKDEGPKESFQFEPLQTAQNAYGKHYNIGDRITVIYNDAIVRHKRITRTRVTIDQGVESIEFDFSDIPSSKGVSS